MKSAPIWQRSGMVIYMEKEEKKRIHLPHDHGQHEEHVLEVMPDEARSIQAAEIFHQLSDGSRLRILWLLCHSEECVCNIAAAVEMSMPAVSHHLRNLKSAGMIASRREGKEVYYRLADTAEAELVHRMVDEVFEMHCPGQCQKSADMQ